MVNATVPIQSDDKSARALKVLVVEDDDVNAMVAVGLEARPPCASRSIRAKMLWRKRQLPSLILCSLISTRQTLTVSN